jgi:hypothetical protein
MPIERIKTRTLRLMVDDVRTIDVKVESKRNADLNKALLDPALFPEFARDPKEFAARYDINIDREISDQLVTKLHGLDNLETVDRFINGRGFDDRLGATLWAIASPVYSVASTKVAVAF